MRSFMRDMRAAARSLARSPGLVLAVCLSLGTGAGANTTVLSWIQSLVLDPYPAVSDPDRLVALNLRSPDGEDWPIPYPVLRDWQAAEAFDGIAGWPPMKLGFRRPQSEGARPVYAMLVSSTYFDVLGVPPALGSTFAQDDEVRATPVAVLSDLFWRRELAADPSAIGRAVLLNGQPFTVVGVAPPAFYGTYLGANVDLWVPLTTQPILSTIDTLDDRRTGWLQAVARLRPDVSQAVASVELDALARRSSQAAGDAPVTGALVRRLRDLFLGSLVTPLLTLMLTITSLVLLVATANVANLLLARAASRGDEMALRRALGASRSSLVRLVLSESAILAVLGTGIGILVASAARGAFHRLMPPAPVPVVLPIRLDVQVLLVAALVGGLTLVGFGLMPGLRSAATGNASMRDDGRTRRRARVQDGLVVFQVALSLTALVVAGLLLRSLDAARGVDLGFLAPEDVFVVNTDFAAVTTDGAGQRSEMERLLVAVRALPAVHGAALSTMVPLGFGGHRYAAVRVEGYDAGPDEDVSAERIHVSDEYFGVMGIDIVQGRALTGEDGWDAARVVVVNEATARRVWPGADPVGRQLDQGTGPATVVGVARDAKYRDLDDRDYEVVYWPLEQRIEAAVALHVRTTGSAAGVAGDVRAAFAAVSRDLPFDSPRTLAEHMEASTFVQRVGGTLIGVFALLALCITGVGLYAVMGYGVARRTREIGVRVAVGAARHRILGMVLREALVRTLWGLGLGVPLALAAGIAARSQLLGISPADPSVLCVAAGTLLLIAVVGALGPALRASRLSPLRAISVDRA